MDLIRQKESLLELGIERLSRVHEDDAPIGNISCHRLDDIFLAWMIGLNCEVNPYISTVVAGIEAGIERNEWLDESKSYHMHRLHKYKALGHWALGEGNNRGLWKAVCGYIKEASYSGSVWQKNKWLQPT